MKTNSTNNLVSFIESKIVEKITELINQGFASSYKEDESPVTELDFYISSLMEENLDFTENICFFSEENFGKLSFPAYILDPLDGTKEFITGTPEFAMSLGYMHSAHILDKKNEGWIFNPLTGESFRLKGKRKISKRKKLLGLISNSEFEKGLFEGVKDRVVLKPIGSIAYKLGLLARGECDFVITKRPKNIWDIAGGTILCSQYGISMFQNGIKIKKLDQVLFKENMLWCFDKDLKEITSSLF